MNYTPIFGSTSGDANLNLVKTTDYVGNRIYENGSLKRVLFDGGYIEGGVFYYYITDHLGNVRVVANSSGTVEQRNHYYPYGMVFAESALSAQDRQPYKYNGKELDQMHGLNLYDYSARQMEPALGRFTTMYPMCEKYYDWSPYAYVNNNPMKYIDPTGMMTDWFQYEDELIWRDSQAKTITENNKTYNNIGSSAKFDNDDGSVSSFYQNVGFRSNTDIDAFRYILSNPEQLGKQLSSKGNLPDFAKTELLKASIHAGQEEFASHPVTKATVNIVTSIASGTIEGAMALGSLGAGLFTKAAAKGGATIVGEGMKRVSMEAAKHHGSVILNNMPKFMGTADQITSQMMTYNRQWLLHQMRSGRPIIDIGLDPMRIHPSIFYQMEQSMMKNYLKRHPNAFKIITP
jgi:RHS repeat-associated protein